MTSPKPLWSPSEDFISNSNINRYKDWLDREHDLRFKDYQELWNWSTTEVEAFWGSLWHYFNIKNYSPYSKVLSSRTMPGCRWFEGAKINFAEHVFRNKTTDYPAIIFKQEGEEVDEFSWVELEGQVSKLREHLSSCGVGKGDAVVGYLPNSPHAIVAFLAANSLGAIWSSCSPDFGSSAVIDRFAQVEPKVLIAVNGYKYGGKSYDKSDIIDTLSKEIDSIKEIITIDYLGDTKSHRNWLNNLPSSSQLEFTPVEFNDPIWVLYSSGTTGIPKAITHSQGGILLEHLKYLTFHNNVKPGDRCFWYTTTGWMMWNYIQSSLLCQATVVLYDGSPAYPEIDSLWQLAEEVKINHLGTSAGYIVANMKEGVIPKEKYDLSSLASIGSTGSPLPPEGFEWIYSHIKSDLWLTSISGGTDVCSAFVGGNPVWPVYMGEIQCRALGCKLEAFDEDGNSILESVGEMVITEPMPSMPIYFWNDDEYSRYKSSYFDSYPEVWRHGDWTEITERNGVIIHGRSDATLNRGGVRIGTSEIYRAVDKINEVVDSLIVCIETEGGNYYMPLFVVLKDGSELSDALVKKVNRQIRSDYSPRHVPDEIIAVPDIPYTISGKKTETPVKKVLMGKDISKSMNKDALKNPKAMDFFMEFAKNRK